MVCPKGELPFPAEADFVISGTVDPDRRLPEGPFGDHLGYYSLAHDFPVLNVDRVRHRPDAIWPFTVVGRPPQEDTSFGAFIHELTGPVIPTVIHGVREVHAIDAAGVHPLLLAIGSERYVPYARERVPQELLTIANSILGQGQLSLAKYLWIAAGEDDPGLDTHDIPRFFRHMLERVDWRRDLHFQTRTTIDTLDYSGSGFNEGSKLVIAARARSVVNCRPNSVRDGRCRRDSTTPAWCCRASSPYAVRRFARMSGVRTAMLRPPSRGSRPRCRSTIRCARSAGGGGRRQRLHRAHASQLPVGGVHPLESRRRHRRGGSRDASEALGLSRSPGDRRPHQAASRSAACGRPRRDEARGCPGRDGWAAPRAVLKNAPPHLAHAEKR